MRRYATRTLSAMALLSALQVVLARFIIPMPSSTMRFSIEAVPIVIAGYLFGPVPGMLVGLVGDYAGTLFSPYGYNPVFALPPALIGLCAGLLRPLVIRRVSFPRVAASFLPAVALGSVLWQSYWLARIYGTRSFTAFLTLRGAQFAVTTAVNAAVIYGLFRTRVFESLRLWPPVPPQATQAVASAREAEIQGKPGDRS